MTVAKRVAVVSSKAGFTRNFDYARKRSGCGRCCACPFTLHAREAYYS